MVDATGRKSDARPIYEEILKLEPDNAIALNNLAYMLAESGGDLDQALTLAQRAQQKWPKDPNVADTLGWIYIKKNLSDNAVRIFTELVTQSPEVSTYHYHLAMALFQKGDKDGARKRLNIALQKKPPKDEETKIKDLINRLG
jgi:Flp pilus assembly protein TadD